MREKLQFILALQENVRVRLWPVIFQGECYESNPGLLGKKRERYLCAEAPTQISIKLNSPESSSSGSLMANTIGCGESSLRHIASLQRGSVSSVKKKNGWGRAVVLAKWLKRQSHILEVPSLNPLGARLFFSSSTNGRVSLIRSLKIGASLLYFL